MSAARMSLYSIEEVLAIVSGESGESIMEKTLSAPVMNFLLDQQHGSGENTKTKQLYI